MNFLVLGGCGFIGSHIVDKLRYEGHHVRVYDRNPEKYRPPFSDVEYHLAAFNNHLDLSEALTDIDIVIHSLSTSVPSTSNEFPIDDITGNLINTVNLLNLMIKIGVKRILFLSSGGTVYGVPMSIPVTEDHATNPNCSYGIIKLAIEKYLLMYNVLIDLKPIIIRASNPYGIRQGHLGVQGFISTALTRVLKDESIVIFGDGGIVRDYLYVTDLVDLCYQAAISSHCGVFNGSSGMGFSLDEILKYIESVSVNNIDIINSDERGYDIPKIILSNEKAKKIFSWDPKIGIEEGIKILHDWLQYK